MTLLLQDIFFFLLEWMNKTNFKEKEHYYWVIFCCLIIFKYDQDKEKNFFSFVSSYSSLNKYD